ncbi:MAG: hypothetical protein DMD33_13395 [Gemmatimonadetes bacterium]|nr:MAG: hypothetical protein DMD33_13395 [Gemmatimonadota bacterium]
MRRAHVVRAWWGSVALIAGVWGCETARNPGGVQRDVIPPTITLSAASDTQQIASGLAFTVNATDNLGLKDIRLTYSGGYIAQTDTVFTSAVTSLSKAQTITFPAGSGAGGLITIIGRATDGAGNFSEDTIVIFLNNVQALTVTLLSPTTGAVASSGRNLPVSVRAVQLGGIARVGFLIAPRSAVSDPTTPPTDSLVFTPPQRQPSDTTYTDTLTVQATTGTFTVTGFAVDAGGRRALSSSVVVTVQSAANDVTPPVVSYTISSRVEVNDNITVHATDPSGISWIGFRVDTLGGVVPIRFDTVNVSAGNLTSVDSTFTLQLPLVDNQLPKSAIVRGYACDLAAARNCAYSQSSTVITGTAPRGAPVRAAAASGGTDTVIVVAGNTHPLPLGGHIADAIFNTNRRELYLTNDALGRVEVFNLATNTFDPNGILTAGPVPWGIALWPVDTLGHYDNNMVVVADAGGTELSILDASTRQLLWRQDLPQFLIEKYSVVLTAGAGLQPVITVHDVSDRPQYVGTVCRVTTGSPTSTCASDSIYAIYSTTPTQSSTSPFNGKATLRMEKLVNTATPSLLFSHLFYELGDLGANVTGDTLRIEIVRRNAPSQVLLTACARVTVNMQTFGFGDQTFVRNSGNFTHGFIGEGGNITTSFARVFAYSAKNLLSAGVGTDTSCVMATGFPEAGQRDRDFGMSPGVNVSDFISNTGIHVVSVATNFNGLTNLVRADSIYYIDDALRLKGTSGVGAGTPGMDMNYNHTFAPSGPCAPTCGGTDSTNRRIVFAASPDTSILAFDTYFFNLQKRFVIRDPIVGPLRVALDTIAKQQYLFAITTRGLVVIALPTITNSNPQAPPVRTFVSGTSLNAPKKVGPARTSRTPQRPPAPKH